MNELEQKATIERPKICSIDLDDKTISVIKDLGFKVYNGTLGSKIKVPNNTQNSSHQILLDYNFPLNFHEYDIIIIDLNNSKTIEYLAQDHALNAHTGKSSIAIFCAYPETLFNPRPLSSFILSGNIQELSHKKNLIIVFSSKSYEIEYEPVKITEKSNERQNIEKYNIYSFWDDVPLSTQKFGNEMVVNEMIHSLQILLEKYKNGSNYNQTFSHPTNWNGNESKKSEKFFALMNNLSGDIVSFYESRGNSNLFLLPQIQDKTNFINDFLTKCAPEIFPELFPFSNTSNWKLQEEYWLPRHSIFLNEKELIQKEYEEKLTNNNKQIENNLAKYSFLHDIISESGSSLVSSLIRFFHWLEFKNVKDYDATNKKSTVLEEDIQIELEDGLLIIECKGIGGTSTDSDCNQISKIKHRRCKERNKFDVFALYIVNHQRFMPPLKRQNPPFSTHQIQDAINDERGLLSTWQLFNLYFQVEDGIISKKEARDQILDFGLINLKPKNLIFIFEPTEFFKDGTICIIKIEDVLLAVNDELFLEKNGKFEKANIVDIQQNGKPIQKATNGEFGIKLSSKISKKTIIWKKITM